MDWTQQFDSYCERTDLTLWSEPVNALTNAAFVIVALWMWRRSVGITGARVLCAILFLIGLGSALFHTYATAWASLADTAPIGIFILVYLFLVNRVFVNLPVSGALFGTLMFAPFAAIMVPLLNMVPFLRISDFYWTVPILLVIYGLSLRESIPDTARGLLVGAAILSVSIVIRSLDEIVCTGWPLGTHFTWHLLNAAMLGYLIHVYIAHVLAGRQVQR